MASCCQRVVKILDNFGGNPAQGACVGWLGCLAVAPKSPPSPVRVGPLQSKPRPLAPSSLAASTLPSECGGEGGGAPVGTLFCRFRLVVLPLWTPAPHAAHCASPPCSQPSSGDPTAAAQAWWSGVQGTITTSPGVDYWEVGAPRDWCPHVCRLPRTCTTHVCPSPCPPGLQRAGREHPGKHAVVSWLVVCVCGRCACTPAM